MFCKFSAGSFSAVSKTILQGNMRLTIFFKLHRMCTLLHRSKCNILAKIGLKISNFRKMSAQVSVVPRNREMQPRLAQSPTGSRSESQHRSGFSYHHTRAKARGRMRVHIFLRQKSEITRRRVRRIILATNWLKQSTNFARYQQNVCKCYNYLMSATISHTWKFQLLVDNLADLKNL